MSSFRNLAREIHRRSVWQVLSVYLLACWGVLQLVDVLAQSYGLPDWVPPFALILLLLGLPVVLATAIVQEGGPGRETWTDPGAMEPDEESLLAGEPRPLRTEAIGERGFGVARESAGRRGLEDPPDTSFLSRLLTWRNALLGGVFAFAFLGLAVAGYFILWALGIGPVGSLVAQGALDERSRVVLADFGNSTDDPSLGEVVTEALRVDLARSPNLNLSDPSNVARGLERMGRSLAEDLPPEVALELARREGLKAVIQGEIAPVGQGFLLTAAIVAAEDGRTLASFRETAADPGEVIPAIDRLSEAVRQRAGESLPAIRRGEPLEAVTTSSLEALRSYSRANQLAEQGEVREALLLLEEAVDQDPAFAMAWRKLGVMRSNVEVPVEGIVRAAREAWEHRDRLTRKERYQTEAFYYRWVTGDHQAEERAYRRVLELDPDDSIGLNNLALLLAGQGDLESALRFVERAVTGPGESETAHYNFFGGLLSLDRMEEADEALVRFEERFPDHPLVLGARALRALHLGDGDAVHSAGEAIVERRGLPPGWRLRGAAFPVGYDLAVGRVDEARDHIESVAGGGARDGEGEAGLALELIGVQRLGEVEGDPGSVTSLLDRLEAVERFRRMEPRERPYGELIAVLLQADQIGEARALYERWEDAVSEGVLGVPYERERREAWARLQAAEGADREALQIFEELEAARGCARCYRLERADLLARLGRNAEAIELLWSQVTEPRPHRLALHPSRRVLALERLGPLHEEAGDTAAALRAYRAFAEAWTEADPEMQPRVERARERAAALEEG